MSSTTITRVETSGADRRLRLEIPVEEADRQYHVEIRLMPEAGAAWPPGFLARTFGSITDPTFVRPPQDAAQEPLSLD